MAQTLNFHGVTVLVLDRNAYYRSLVSQMLRGFGVQNVITCDSGEEAKEALKTSNVELCIMEADLPDMKGEAFLNWIRRENKEPLRFMPVIVLSGYAQLSLLKETRDAGSNLLIKKPLSAQILFDRLGWLARAPRPHIETGKFVGPDRRFREKAPADAAFKRESDRPAEGPQGAVQADETRNPGS
jgi:CheY-like chemotaxis protein